MRIVSLVGARPQFVKAAVMCRAFAGLPVSHRLVHTGQHYDDAMSEVFFRELSIPAPAHNLGAGSGSHAQQTAEIMKRLEPVLEQERPDWLLLYGDTNSTLSGALVASKMHIRCAHVEAGLRSGDRAMPEEVNRIVTDHLSELLFCPTGESVKNLEREGLGERARMTGDVMFDAVRVFGQISEERGGPLTEAYRPDAFALATLHRAGNTDNPERLQRILGAIDAIARTVCPVVMPLHPRTTARLAEMKWRPEAISVVAPLSYLEMLLLEKRARFILTDSGGVQKEAYFSRKPCITLRDETEWVETLHGNCNVLAGSDPVRIQAAVAAAAGAGPWTEVYGDGEAGVKIAEALMR